MSTIRQAFTDFLITNFAFHSKPLDQTGDSSDDLVQKLIVDFTRPHECTRRLDLLLRLKEEVIDKESEDNIADVFFSLKVARIFNIVMQTSCPTLEDKITKYNLKVASLLPDCQLTEIGVKRSELASLIFRRTNFNDTSGNAVASDNVQNQELEPVELLEWLLLNFSIWIEATFYFKASKLLEMACNLSGIKIDFQGQLGRRTKFQQKSLPQLIAKPVQSNLKKWNFQSHQTTLPTNIQNNDDTVLNKLSLDENLDTGYLNVLQTTCVLATTWLKLCEDSFIELRFEVVDALILDQKCIGFMMSRATLILRSEAERQNTRRVERACQQMESLVSELEDRNDARFNVEEIQTRIQDLFLACPLQPVWTIKKFYAKVLMSLALTNEAIGVFESIYDWESVVECYSILNMKEKALKILELLQERNPSNPFYLCMIGEIRCDKALLNQVLKITNDRYAKAHKILGMMALNEKNYHESFRHLKRVFELTPLSIQAVYNCGISALEIGEIKHAITAFHHCVSIDPENYRAWNNLAAAYVQSNQKARAVQVLNQGLKVHSESERMWSNFFEIAAELPSKNECLLALKRYLEFKPEKINLQPLMKIILTNTKAAEDTLYPAPPLQDPLNEEELKLLVECLEKAHQICTLEPMAIRLMASLKKPSETEKDPQVFESFVALMDLAENRELRNTKGTPDYGNLIKALLIVYEVRSRYAQLIGKDTKALNKIIGYRIRPLLKRVDAELGNKLDTDEQYAPLKHVVEEAKLLLSNVNSKRHSQPSETVECGSRKSKLVEITNQPKPISKKLSSKKSKSSSRGRATGVRLRQENDLARIDSTTTVSVKTVVKQKSNENLAEFSKEQLKSLQQLNTASTTTPRKLEERKVDLDKEKSLNKKSTQSQNFSLHPSHYQLINSSTPKKAIIKVSEMERTDFVRVKKARPAISKKASGMLTGKRHIKRFVKKKKLLEDLDAQTITAETVRTDHSDSAKTPPYGYDKSKTAKN